MADSFAPDIVSTNIITHDDMVIDHFGHEEAARSVVFTFTSLNNREMNGLGWGGKFLLDSGYDVIAFKRASLSYSRRSVSGPLWAFAAAGCIARTTGIAGVCFTAFGLMGFSG